MTRIALLREVLREALDRPPAGSWVYLPEHARCDGDTRCLILDDEPDADDLDEDGPAEAKRLGFPCAGLEVDTLASTAERARQLDPRPSDELLLESFQYYLRFDAYLPHIGAPDPPPWDETQRRLDEQFVDLLGPERDDVPCRQDGCTRGAVQLSVQCRRHHFENVTRRAYPFPE